MPKGYWVAHIDVTDQENYVKEYVSKNAGPIAAFGGRFLVRGGQNEVPQGKVRSRTVVLEFPTYQDALDCMNSPAYQALIKARAPFSEADILVIEGYDGPQPEQ